MMRKDGFTQPIKEAEIDLGVVVRPYDRDGAQSPFSDAIILGTTPDGSIRVARPYAFPGIVNLDTPMMWAEIYEIPLVSFLANYHVVLLASGAPYKVGR
jgi:hypothetical protein